MQETVLVYNFAGLYTSKRSVEILLKRPKSYKRYDTVVLYYTQGKETKITNFLNTFMKFVGLEGDMSGVVNMKLLLYSFDETMVLINPEKGDRLFVIGEKEFHLVDAETYHNKISELWKE